MTLEADLMARLPAMPLAGSVASVSQLGSMGARGAAAGVPAATGGAACATRTPCAMIIPAVTAINMYAEAHRLRNIIWLSP